MTFSLKNIITRLSHIAVFSLLIASVACSSSRHAVSDTASDVPTPESLTLSGIASSYRHWQDVSLPVKVSIRKPASVTLSGRLTMVRDRSIHLSFKMLGIEVASAYVDRDSVFIYERLHKYLLAEPMSRLSGKSNISLTDMQDLILARIFAPGTGTLNSNNTTAFSLTGSDSDITITPAHTPGYTLTYAMTAGVQPLIKQLTVNIPSAGTSTVSYSDWAETPAGQNPQHLEVSGRLSGKPLVASVTLDLGEAKWDSSPKNKWSVPRKATRITMAALAEMLKHM
ncbi:MAG: DUF4292 domain-containing protein [Muribaculaceae bacterium]|nr:DUF4292 domain-containing protein [Muribaculaceae bacterium]